MFSDRTHFTLRRLHSLTGVVPIGAFLVEHFFTNSFAIFGPDEYNAKVEFLLSLPYLVLIEALVIWIPIAFHAILGVVIAWSARYNLRTLSYGRNWAYFFQRMSGLYLVLFIAVHMAKTRFAGVPPAETFQHLAGYLSNPLWFLFYALGIVASAWHFGNGLFTFAVSWGITLGRRTQRVWSLACVGVFVIVAVVGLRALTAFVLTPERREPTLIFEHHRTEAPAPLPAPGSSGL